MPTVTLAQMTHELAVCVYAGYESDPLHCEGPFFAPARFSEAWVETYLERSEALRQRLFAVLLDGVPIGEVKLYNISDRRKHCEVSVRLKQERYRNFGYGTAALKESVRYAGETLGLKTMGGRAKEGDARARRAFQKAGFFEAFREGGTVHFERELWREEVIKPITVLSLTLELYRAFEAGREILLTPKGKRPRYGRLPYDDERVRRHHRMDQLLGNKTFAILIEGEPVGIMRMLARSDDEWNDSVTCTMRSHEYQNRGYGRQGLLWLIRYAKETLGLEKLYADIEEDNTHARHVFEALGFRPVQPRFRDTETRYELKL